MVNADIKVKIHKDMLLEDIEELRRNLFDYNQFIEETLEKIGADEKYRVDDIDNTVCRLSEEIASLISDLQ